MKKDIYDEQTKTKNSHSSAEAKPGNGEHPDVTDQLRASFRQRITGVLHLVFNSFLALLSSLFLGLILMVLLFVYSQEAREWSIAQGLPALLSLAGIQLEVQNLRSPSASDWTLGAFSVRMDDKEFIHIEQLHLQVNDWSLFNQGLDIRQLSANNIQLALSTSATTKDSESEIDRDLFEILNQPLGLRIQTLDINRLELSGLARELPALHIRGKALLNIQSSLNVESAHWLNTELHIKLLENIPTSLNLQATLDNTLSGRIELSVDEAADGWLGQLMHFPETQAIDGQLELILVADAASELINWKLTALQLPWNQHQLGLNGQGSWQIPTRKLQVEEANLVVDQAIQTLQGWWQDQSFAIQLGLNKLPLSLAEPFQDLVKGGQVTGDLKASGTFSQPEIDSQLELNTSFMQQPASIRLDASGNLDKLSIKQAKVELAQAVARVTGVVRPEQQTLDLDVQQLQGPVSIINIFGARLPEGLSIDLEQTEGKLTGDLLAPHYSGQTQAKGHYEQQAFTLAGAFEGNTERVKLMSATLKTDGARVEVSGLIDWQQAMLDLSYTASNLPDKLSSLIALQLPDTLSFEIDSKGKLNGPFEQLKIAATAEVQGEYQSQALTSQLALDGSVEKLNFSEFTAQLDKAQVNASGTVEPFNQTLSIELSKFSLHTDILQPLVALPEGLSADINGKGAITGRFNKPNFTGQLAAQGKYKQAGFELSADLDAKPDVIKFHELSSLLTLKQQQAKLEAKGQYSLAENKIDAQIKTSGLPLAIIELAELSLPEDLSAQINSDISIKGTLPFPQVSGSLQTRGQFKDETFNLTFGGSQDENTLILHEINAKWMDTSLYARGEISQEILDFDFRLKQFQLADLSKIGLTLPTGADIPSGRLDINLGLMGSVKQPQVKGHIKLAMDELLFNQGLESKQVPLLLNTQLDTKDQRLIAETTIFQGKDSKVDLKVSALLSPVLTWLLDKKDNRTLSELALDVSAQGELGLAWLNDWLEQQAQSFAGKAKVDAQLLGSIKDPCLQGQLTLTEGHYRNAISQTSLEDAEITLKFEDQAIKVVRATANDGQSGTLTLEGEIDLADTEDGRIDLTLVLDQASLVRREDIEGEASGQLELSGSLKDMKLSGTLDVAPFQIMLDRIASDSIPEIEVRSVANVNSEDSQQSTPTTVHLNLQVNVDQQAYIRGRGLDAELKGKLQLTGTNRQPNYNGRFQVIRGAVDLFAKTFKLEQGSVLFSNDAVSLFAQARHKAKELTFIATLEGMLDKLKISLRTEPALPEDEAVSRLLFGKSVRNITPIQAIQLANAIQTLRGESSGFDPLGTARDILQVDRISIESQETSEGKGVAIGLGKYVTEKVYVEVTRTPEPTQPWKGSVEVELTPNINLETTTSGSSGFGGVELQWKRDY